MRKRNVAAAMGVILAAGCAASSLAQTAAIGPRVNAFPDGIVSSVGSRGSNGIDFYGATGGIGAYAFASDSCNIGTSAAIWIDDSSSQYRNQHPVIGCQAYRLHNGRFEMVGFSWLKHGFCAADSCGTVGGVTGCTNVSPSPAPGGNCQTDFGASGGGCDWLGYGRATDTYSAGLNGGQGYLGPRSEVNAWSGSYPYPWIRQGTNTVGCLNKRLLIRKNDLDTAQYPGAQFFGEVVYVFTDEWPGQRNNNYSYRKLTVGALRTGSGTNSCTGSEQSFGLTFANNEPTVDQKPALYAWKVVDPTVKIAHVDVPNDGRIVVASKAVDRGDGTWNYEYAVLNMNSDRGVNSFMIPKSTAASVQIMLPSNNFKGVEYHSGEPYSMTPWTTQTEGAEATWSTQAWDVNQNANAIRWSTLYNFRMISNQAPKSGNVRLGLFKPAVVSGDPSVVEVVGLDIPADPPCRIDFDQSGTANIDDIFSFLNAWFASEPRADFDGQNGLNIDDVFNYLTAWFAGC